ncbi:hypothetical protein JDV02_001379 [Purpureocillium takamizusanense]|uniref:Zn(2)-C6 fungal-type domain-containing protein n=1 Tax=Purpureocillium takamizusanense TaxID=2060973 RepID=A0A9Q8Q6Z3_9HYPO|nr:uncharacterized protein JDV02_001379 [Purpureocillium takamizusanense]UNI14783.1 hypothetical protein JDV02_001379 [Purpureocillium takamizusanense]
MPRTSPARATQRKRRSRKGCWPCKSRKVKCGEEHPACKNCLKTGDICDYSIRLNWEGRRTKRSRRETQPDFDDSAQAIGQELWFNNFATATPTSAGSPQFLMSEPTSRQTNSPEPVLVPAAKKRRSTFGELTFVDETPSQAAFAARKRFGDLSGLFSLESSAPAAFVPSPAQDAQHNKAKSFTELRKLDLGEAHLSSSPFMTHVTASPVVPDLPLTPAASSYSDDILCQSHWLDKLPLGSPDSRLSMSSDMIDAGDPSSWYTGPEPHPETENGQRFYGFDLGRRDDDVASNDDEGAVSLVTPTRCEPHRWAVNSSDLAGKQPPAPGGGQVGGYYDEAVPILIPWELEPLPDKLRNNKMNLLYFHHFINHTAKVLVPYHDTNSNPMSRSLPQMAFRNEGLLSLLLAYSAAHRSRWMQTKVPEMRMAEWAQDVFPGLRQSLGDGQRPVSDTTLAMAVMLASLEIMSPGALGQGISWRQHLNLASELMMKRVQQLGEGKTGGQLEGERLFIRSWIARANMHGMLSPSRTDDAGCRILPLDMTTLMPELDEIDCIMGYSARCARLLGQVADMARRCDRERIGPGGQVLAGWVPHTRTIEAALALDQELTESMKTSSKPCMHVRTGNIQMRDLAEMAATNEAFHWAGRAHLHRRVLGKGSSDAVVRAAVEQMVHCLEQTRPGGAAELGVVFPMFTAGCEAVDEGQRSKVLARFKSAERSGMEQVRRARRLMEAVWDDGRPWETLIRDEYIG